MKSFILDFVLAWACMALLCWILDVLNRWQLRRQDEREAARRRAADLLLDVGEKRR